MLPERRRPEGNIAQLRGTIFQCWSRLTVDICYITENIIPHSALPAYSNP